MASPDEDMPLTLPDTQNLDDMVFTQSQEVTSIAQIIWGRLCPNKSNLKTLEMSKASYTLGRQEKCDICLTTDQLLPKWWSVISKVHLRISREVFTDGRDAVVYLEDLSHNGTYVNKVLVGRGKRIMLRNNDTISLAQPVFEVYIYMSAVMPGNTDLPPELRTKYAVSRTLGSGICGEVKLVFSIIGCKRFALKTISKRAITSSLRENPAYNSDKIMNEVRILKALRHPCIIKMEEIIDTPSCLYILLELMEGGELFDRVTKNRGLPEKIAKVIFYQIALAVRYLHDCGITHRDLKPENILLASHADYPIVKVSDFGLSKFVSTETMMRTFCGTPMYVAPEILLTHGRGTYTNQVDIWSLGVILYVCLSGHAPFVAHNKKVTLHEQIVKGLYRFPATIFAGISPKAIELIRCMMTTDPLKRITIKQVLVHAWVQDRRMREIVNSLLSTTDENVVPNTNTVMNPRTMDDYVFDEHAPKSKRPRCE